jgi:hypothetical protein
MRKAEISPDKIVLLWRAECYNGHRIEIIND